MNCVVVYIEDNLQKIIVAVLAPFKLPGLPRSEDSRGLPLPAALFCGVIRLSRTASCGPLLTDVRRVPRVSEIQVQQVLDPLLIP